MSDNLEHEKQSAMRMESKAVSISRRLRRYLTCTAGGIAVSVATATPVLMGAFGLASDFAVYTMKKSSLQAAADAAALAATRELSVIQSSGTGSSSSSPSSSSSSGSGGSGGTGGGAVKSESSEMIVAEMSSISADSGSGERSGDGSATGGGATGGGGGAIAGDGDAEGGPIAAIARSYVNATLGGNTDTISTKVTIDEATGTVKVTVTDRWQPFFAHYLGADITPISSDAKAALVGDTKVCVIALHPTARDALIMTADAHIQAKGCGIYSNSTNSAGVYLGGGSTIEADLVCSAGGVLNRGGTSSTEILTDCPPLADPLQNRAAPSFGGCDFRTTVVMSGTRKFTPGVYCGGLIISGTAQATFEEGEYIIKDGPFVVSSNASVKGENVAFFLTGTLSLLQFSGRANIDLSGAEDGDMAGLLFFEDPKAPWFRFHNISSTNAKNLTGTIYLPRGFLRIDPNANVAENSAYTAIVTRRLMVENGPNLVLNTNYGATSVPVPEGIRSSSDVVLAE